MAELEIAKHTKKAYKIWTQKEFPFKHKIQEFIIEVAIIVFAVLFSVYVHGITEKHHEHVEAQKYLKGFVNDMQHDLAEMKEDKDYLLQLTETFESIAKGGPVVNKTNLSLQELIQTQVYLRPNVSRFQALKSSGKINQIDDKELIDKIFSLYEEEIPGLVNSGNNFSEYKTKYLIEYLEQKKALDDSDQKLEELLLADENTKYFANRLNQRAELLAIYYDEVIKKHEELQGMIYQSLQD